MLQFKNDLNKIKIINNNFIPGNQVYKASNLSDYEIEINEYKYYIFDSFLAKQINYGEELFIFNRLTLLSS